MSWEQDTVLCIYFKKNLNIDFVYIFLKVQHLPNNFNIYQGLLYIIQGL